MIIKLRSLSLLILMALVAYVLCEDTGIAKTFNQNPIEIDSQQSTEIVVTQVYRVGMLKGDKFKEFTIFRGAIKKNALDGMEFIGTLEILFPDGATDLVVNKVIEEVAKKYGGNVAIVEDVSTKSKILTKDGGI